MRRIPAVLIVIFLVFPFFMAALMTVSVSTWVLDRNFYADLLGDARLYQIPSAAWSRGWLRVEALRITGMSVESVGGALKQILTPEYLRAQALKALDDAFDFIDGRSTVFDPSIDLVPVKKALSGGAGKRFARTLAEDLPVGKAGDRFVMEPGSLPRVRPSSISVDRAAALIVAGLPAYVKAIPDTLRLSDATSPLLTPRRWGPWPGFSALRALVLADVILLLLASAFWVAAAFTGGSDRRERLQWFGWSLFMPSVLVFLCGLSISVGLGSEWVRFGVASARLESLGYGPEFPAAVLEVARLAMSRVATGFLATGAIAGGVSLGLLAWAWTTTGETDRARKQA